MKWFEVEFFEWMIDMIWSWIPLKNDIFEEMQNIIKRWKTLYEVEFHEKIVNVKRNEILKKNDEYEKKANPIK